ncbi:uncharacterized protein VTP21DRAFT_6259 [Calcarisporiella thermophila]|uniref:uncharacterized protein n=1 Tax=Calcarisporiella thermophila TaxID=911321 RepID=UPI0037430EE4
MEYYEAYCNQFSGSPSFGYLNAPTLNSFPTESQFEAIVDDYLESLSPKKRDKAILTRAMYRQVLAVLLNPRNTQMSTAQFRFWAKKMFTLVQDRVYHEGKPVAVREQMYEIMVKCHREASHGGRDKTSALVRRQYSWIPKELIARFVRQCPLCNARRSSLKPSSCTTASSSVASPARSLPSPTTQPLLSPPSQPISPLLAGFNHLQLQPLHNLSFSFPPSTPQQTPHHDPLHHHSHHQSHEHSSQIPPSHPEQSPQHPHPHHHHQQHSPQHPQQEQEPHHRQPQESSLPPQEQPEQHPRQHFFPPPLSMERRSSEEEKETSPVEGLSPLSTAESESSHSLSTMIGVDHPYVSFSTLNMTDFLLNSESISSDEINQFLLEVPSGASSNCACPMGEWAPNASGGIGGKPEFLAAGRPAFHDDIKPDFAIMGMDERQMHVAF